LGQLFATQTISGNSEMKVEDDVAAHTIKRDREKEKEGERERERKREKDRERQKAKNSFCRALKLGKSLTSKVVISKLLLCLAPDAFPTVFFISIIALPLIFARPLTPTMLFHIVQGCQ
jgi:hypothetical protein